VNVADIAELWDFDRPDVSEERFRAALVAATGSDALVLRTQLARALGLRRRFEEAAAELDAVPDNGDPLVRTYRELERGRVLNSGGDPDGARAHFLTALAEAEAAGLDHLAADAAHMMAIVEPGEAQLPWAERALAIASASADPRARRWIGSVSHNLGWTLHGLGRHEEALAVWRRALAFREEQFGEEQFREEQGDAGALHIAQWTVARGLRSLGRYEEALAIQRDLAGRVDSDGYVREELGELLLALGRPDEARPHFAAAYAMLSQDEWLAADEPDRLARLAALGAAD
jgi:tetratricopeptide (TPR) repeat protein